MAAFWVLNYIYYFSIDIYIASGVFLFIKRTVLRESRNLILNAFTLLLCLLSYFRMQKFTILPVLMIKIVVDVMLFFISYALQSEVIFS